PIPIDSIPEFCAGCGFAIALNSLSTFRPTWRGAGAHGYSTAAGLSLFPAGRQMPAILFRHQSLA
ncbi:MAG: hypothetical protein ACXWV7_09755, partial [Nitrospira sp.]